MIKALNLHLPTNHKIQEFFSAVPTTPTYSFDQELVSVISLFCRRFNDVILSIEFFLFCLRFNENDTMKREVEMSNVYV